MSDLWQRLARNRELDDDLRAAIEAELGPRGKKALAALESGKIKKYNDFFVVEGRTNEYVVDEDFCTCRDFMYRGRICWHLIAVRIAIATGKFTRVDGWYTDQLK
jgi:predicted nucleic acid-binding Zn finger protein